MCEWSSEDYHVYLPQDRPLKRTGSYIRWMIIGNFWYVTAARQSLQENTLTPWVNDHCQILVWTRHKTDPLREYARTLGKWSLRDSDMYIPWDIPFKRILSYTAWMITGWFWYVLATGETIREQIVHWANNHPEILVCTGQPLREHDRTLDERSSTGF